MNMWRRSLKYWGKYWLQLMGINLGAGFVLILFLSISNPSMYHEKLIGFLSLYPYYVMLTAGFTMMLTTISFFQVYYPMLVSLGSTRKSAVLGMLAATAGTVIAILAGSALIWGILGNNDIAKAGISLLPLFGGILFLISAVYLIMGIVKMKWGKIGMIFTIGGCAIGGGIFGMLIAKGGSAMIVEVNFQTIPILLIGLTVYCLVGVVTMLTVKKIEVRM